MESSAVINDLKVKVNDRQILSIALPITLAILIPQINMLTNSIFLGRLSNEALGNAGITGVFYLIFAAMTHTGHSRLGIIQIPATIFAVPIQKTTQITLS